MESITENMQALAKLSGGSIQLAVAGPPPVQMAGVSDGRIWVASYASTGSPYITVTTDRLQSPDDALQVLARTIASTLRDLGKRGQQLAEAAERLGL